ncbi:MAG: RIO1 family regulatory kinase/ATPase [Micropruina glycogenica]|uniref:non-specific serine/threonine protein kinase n=1 Tax=Micropruina glycogenica TaxID=75385 RepID=A0A2N9JAN4_9ACTN|nr:RIO1 family regulatory kinase/ATPase [Micropruina glycogenica]SPD85222.1 Serine/threonine protein kinase [Micropruina glycogenica]
MSSQEHAAVDWAALQYIALSEDLGSDQRWSTWRSVDRSSRGPKPRPGWLVTSEAALDTELGLLKTGKEADVFLIERAVPGAESCLLAAKRYRAAEHRLFHRASSYTEGRRGRDSRENRAVRLKSGFGRQIEATRWSQAEFATLKQLWTAGVRVPYPVQVDGGEILMEFIGDGRAAAPRLAQTDPDPDQLRWLWAQVVEAMITFGSLQLVHGDLSPFNVLVRGMDGLEPELVIIDVPQVLDLVSNPNGVDFLHRDCRNLADWFVRKGLPVDADVLLAEVLGAAW